MKVGILTYHRAHNYGAYLQACALCNRLNQEEEIEAEIIDYRMVRELKRYDVRSFSKKKILMQLYKGKYFFNRTVGKAFRRAAEDPIMRKSENSLVSDSLEDFSKFVDGKYDVIVVGSDEIWKVNNFRGFPTAYWLLGDLHCRKFSYAASARVEFEKALTADDYNKIRDVLREYEFIGVRDQFTYREIEKIVDDKQKLHMCCDPSFLYDFEVPDAGVIKGLSERKGFDPKRKTVMVMVDNDETAAYIRQAVGEQYNLVAVFHPYKGFINLPDLEPLEWLSLIKESDFVIASFFHAICFSIINNKQFLAVGTKGKKSKLTELLNTEELMKLYVEIDEKPDISAIINERINIVADHSRFVAEKRRSFDDFLKALVK